MTDYEKYVEILEKCKEKKILSASEKPKMQAVVYKSLECKELADKIYVKILDFFKLGPILSDEDKKIKKLYELWMCLSQTGAEKKIKRYEEKFDKISGGLERQMKTNKLLSIDINEALKIYVDETISILNRIYAIPNMDKILNENLIAESKVILGELSEGLSVGVVDLYSSDAKDKAQVIFNEIAKFRSNVYIGLLTDNYSLLTAKDALNFWKKNQAVKSIDRETKKKVLPEIEKIIENIQNPDDFRSFNKITEMTTKADQFFVLLETRKNGLSVDAINTQLDEITNQMDSNENKIKEIVLAVKGGTMKKNIADVRIKGLLDKKKILEMKLKTVQITASHINRHNSASEILMEQFSQLKIYYDYFITNNYKKFYQIFSMVDFADYIKVLDNTANELEAARVNATIPTLLETLDMEYSRLKDQIDSNMLDDTMQIVEDEAVNQEVEDIYNMYGNEEEKENEEKESEDISLDSILPKGDY